MMQRIAKKHKTSYGDYNNKASSTDGSEDDAMFINAWQGDYDGSNVHEGAEDVDDRSIPFFTNSEMEPAKKHIPGKPVDGLIWDDHAIRSCWYVCLASHNPLSQEKNVEAEMGLEDQSYQWTAPILHRKCHDNNDSIPTSSLECHGRIANVLLQWKPKSFELSSLAVELLDENVTTDDTAIPTNDSASSASTPRHPDMDASTNPLWTRQHKFLTSLSPTEREYFFSDAHVSPERRAELWTRQAELGEVLVNQYAWATPNTTCLKIFEQFSPIIELGCSRNAYWASYVMQKSKNVDIVAYDANIKSGGIIYAGDSVKERNENKNGNSEKSSRAIVRHGGPEVLQLPEHISRTLFLCYPDEDVVENIDSSTGEAQPQKHLMPFGWQCLDQYTGQYIIHVGELAFLDTTLSIDQAPWGRSSSPEFQQRLASEFHCLLKIQLPHWLHVRDSITVWKRSEICPIVFAADDDEEDEVAEYRHVPSEERLPTDLSAPCLAHLLKRTNDR